MALSSAAFGSGAVVRPASGGAFNASDIVLDRHDLLAEVARLSKSPNPPPARADAAALSVMTCDRLDGLGWQRGGFSRLWRELPAMI